MLENDYKFILDFNDSHITKDFLSQQTDLYKICMNPKTENLGKYVNIFNILISIY